MHELCILTNLRELISNISIAFQTYSPKCQNKTFLVPNMLFLLFWTIFCILPNSWMLISNITIIFKIYRPKYTKIRHSLFKRHWKRHWHSCLLWILRNFQKHFFLQNTSSGCFCNSNFWILGGFRLFLLVAGDIGWFQVVCCFSSNTNFTTYRSVISLLYSWTHLIDWGHSIFLFNVRQQEKDYCCLVA